MIQLECLRELDLQTPTQPGRPGHLSAASGLQRIGDRLVVVADDEQQLAVFALSGNAPGSLLTLFDTPLPMEPKRRKAHKADLESLCRLPALPGHPDGALLALGSGSRPNRCRAVLLALDPAGTVTVAAELDLQPLYQRLACEFHELNIEGATTTASHLVLLQRGNRRSRRNALIRLPLPAIMLAIANDFAAACAGLPLEIIDIDLGVDPADVPFGFTDACALPDGRLVFCAVAEDTGNSYDDGTCNAAMLGLIDSDGQLIRTEPVQPAYKIEGIHADVDGAMLRVLMVSDADNPAIAARLLSAVLDWG